MPRQSLLAPLFPLPLAALAAASVADGSADFASLRREALERRRLVLWDDDGCDMTHYPYQRKVLADLPDDVLPRVTVGGHALEGGTAKDGIVTFPADDALFVKGVNDIAITVPEATTLRDFAMRVRF